MGVVNAASSAPFTAFVSPGEFLTLYGSGLASTTNSAAVPFQTSLDQVQVLINQIPAPVYFVSPTQVSVVVPFITTPGSIAQIQVINNGAKSNVVTAFTGETSVGIFTYNPVGGDGIAAAERPDFSIVSDSNPAQVGDTIAVYVAGMGAVTNQPADGTAAPSTTLSDTTSTPLVFIDDAAGNRHRPPSRSLVLLRDSPACIKSTSSFPAASCPPITRPSRSTVVWIRTPWRPSCRYPPALLLPEQSPPPRGRVCSATNGGSLPRPSR